MLKLYFYFLQFFLKSQSCEKSVKHKKFSYVYSSDFN